MILRYPPENLPERFNTMKLEKLTQDEHEELARALFESRQAFMALYVRLSKAYGVTKKPGLLAQRVQIVVDQLRGEMESAFNRDFGAEKGSPYYNQANTEKQHGLSEV